MRERGIRFQQCANTFLQCSDPEALQQAADSLTAQDLIPTPRPAEQRKRRRKDPWLPAVGTLLRRSCQRRR
jgi:hypothetical protein